MPQMAPMNWMSIYIIFSLLYIFIIIFNYFLFLYPPKSFSLRKTPSKINWKW